MLQDLEADERAEEDLVLLEEAAADVLVDDERGVVDERPDAALQVRGGLAGLDALAEEVAEVVQRVLVHGVDLRQVGHHEVDDRAPLGHGHVPPPHVRNLLLRHLRLLHALLDHVAGDLGGGERVDQRLVVQDVPLALGQLLQDGGLDQGQLLAVLRHAHQQLHLLLLDGRVLALDHLAQQLVRQAVHRHREVDQVHLDAHLGQVVRVGVLGGHVQLEQGVVVHVVVPDADQLPVPLLEHGPLQHGLQRRLQLLPHVLQQQRLPVADAGLQLAQHVRVRHRGHLQGRALLQLLDPLVGLPLRVDHQRPARGARHQDGRVRGDRVGRQPAVLPLADLHGVAQRGGQLKARRPRDAELLGLGQPVGHQPAAVDAREGAVVADAGRGQEGVAQQLQRVARDVHQRLPPPHALVLQPPGEFLRALQAVGRELALVCQRLLLRHRLVALLL
mmetsp:Transcript_10027/g.17738  ORF Transcript_10027/g.17738 Transcript_10027/m.17738 type:complete len:446 (-) Transcript_10027:364-1701(-)